MAHDAREVEWRRSWHDFQVRSHEAARCVGATMDDLDVDAMRRFIRMARRARRFPLPPDTPPADLLAHLSSWIRRWNS